MIFSKPIFQLWPEVPDKTLDWPSSAVSQSADSVALNLFAQFPNHINLLWLRVALSEPPHHCIHPVMAAIDVGEDSVSISHWTELGLGLGCLAPGRHQLTARSCRTLDPLEEAGAEPLLDQLGHFASLSASRHLQINSPM